MGDYTKHTLTVVPTEATKEVEELFFKMTDCPGVGNTKSWDYENIAKVSEKLPGVVIVLDGLSEYGGVWRKAWFAGKEIMDWEADITPPEISQSILAQTSYSLDDFKKKKLLAGLSPEDLKLLGIERKD